MRFTISGADRDTGEDIDLVVEAQSEEEATDKASRKGVLVSSCQPVGSSAPNGNPQLHSAPRRSDTAAPPSCLEPDEELPELAAAVLPPEAMGFGNLVTLFNTHPLVAAAAALSFFWCGVMVLIAFAQLGGNSTALGLWNILIAVLYAVIGVGIVRGRAWSYTWGVATNVLNAILGIVQIVAQNNAIMGLLFIVEVLIVVFLVMNSHLFPRQKHGGFLSNNTMAKLAPFTVWNRFLRGGILGVIDERFCTISNSNVSITGKTTGQNAGCSSSAG